MQDQAKDSFGRTFREVGGDEWSIDTGAFPEITPAGVYVPPGGGGEFRYGAKGGIAPTMHFGGIGNFTLSALPIGCRFVPPISFTCKSIGFQRVNAGAVPNTTQIAIYSADGLTRLYRQTKVNLFNNATASRIPCVLTLSTPFDFVAGTVYYIAARTDANVIVEGVSLVDFGYYQMFQDTLPTVAAVRPQGVEYGNTEVIQSTGGGTAAPDLPTTMQQWFSGIQFNQCVAQAPFCWVRKEEGNVAP